MKPISPPPPPPPPMQVMQEIASPLMQELEEGVPPKIRFQKSRKPESLKEIQESPLFQS